MSGGPSVHVSIRHEGVDAAREDERRNQPAVVQSCDAGVEAPEKKITRFAFHLAILEKTASALGVLGFVWATVVLLGGFAGSLITTDFWLITITLLVESARIFSRSHELEWQNHALASRIASKYHSDTQVGASESTSKLQLFHSKNVSGILYILQLVSATGCIVSSVIGLHRSGTKSFDGDNRKNMKVALVIFYSLALSEAVVFWAERIYWRWKVYRGIFAEVVKDVFGDDPKALPSVKRFYYDAYSKCIHGSIFDGLKMDLVSYAEENLVSDICKEQHLGARILRAMVKVERFRDDTLRKIETTSTTVERLIDMLSWTNDSEMELRKIAAGVVEKLAVKNQNSLRVAASPGSLESISCLLDRESRQGSDEYFDKLNIQGLKILKHLTRDQGNCRKLIRNTRELLSKIVRFTRDAKQLLQQELTQKMELFFEEIIGHANRLLQICCSEQGSNHVTMEMLAKVESTLKTIEGFKSDANKLIQLGMYHLNVAMIKKVGLSLEDLRQQGTDPMIESQLTTGDALRSDAEELRRKVTTSSLTMIIDSTGDAMQLLQQYVRSPVTDNMIKKVKLSLKVIKNLASKTGKIGSKLRRQLSKAIFIISNTREILQCGENYPNLQEIGIEILTSLAMEDEGRDRVSQTGGVIPVLVDIFFNNTTVSKKAGDALSNLALNNELNCKKIFKVEGVVQKLVLALDDQHLMLSSGRLLRNLYAYGGAWRYSHREAIIDALPKVLGMILNDIDERLEVSIGLASEIFDLATLEEVAGVNEEIVARG